MRKSTAPACLRPRPRPRPLRAHAALLRAPALACGLLVFWTACAAGWEVKDPGVQLPDLSAEQRRMLGDVNPYVLAFDDTLTPFLCRWRSPATLAVELAAEASEEDRRVLEIALRAWEQAGLGLRFALGQEPAAISVGFSAGGGYSGTTRADCALGEGADVLRNANLVYARVLLRRVDVDALGRPVPLTPEERVGAALHELGHALGFQGHPRRGATVMLSSVDHVRWAGRRLLRDEPFRDLALAALYQLPSGTRLGEFALARGSTRELDSLRDMALGLGYPGPLLRMGDREARIAWHRSGASDLFFRLPDIAEVFRDPERFHAIPGPAARRLLDGAVTSQ